VPVVGSKGFGEALVFVIKFGSVIVWALTDGTNEKSKIKALNGINNKFQKRLNFTICKVFVVV
jgi:hypothetical protein